MVKGGDRKLLLVGPRVNMGLSEETHVAAPALLNGGALQG